MSDEQTLIDELRALEARREALNVRIRVAQDRQRYGTDPHEIARGRRAEADLLKELDRLMTRCRAIEGRILMARSGQKRPW